MNEQVIRSLINLKFDMAEKVLDCLPQGIAKEARQLGKTVLEIAVEKLGEQVADPADRAGSAGHGKAASLKTTDGKIHSIDIE